MIRSRVKPKTVLFGYGFSWRNQRGVEDQLEPSGIWEDDELQTFVSSPMAAL